MVSSHSCQPFTRKLRITEYLAIKLIEISKSEAESLFI